MMILPATASQSPAANDFPTVADETLVQQLAQMGFEEESCRVALQLHNNSLEGACSYLLA